MTTGEVIALIKAFGGSGGGSSGGGVLVVHDVNDTLDKTWKEIHDAGFCVCVFGDEYETNFAPIYNIGINTDPDEWYVLFGTSESGRNYSASSETGYPTRSL